MTLLNNIINSHPINIQSLATILTNRLMSLEVKELIQELQNHLDTLEENEYNNAEAEKAYESLDANQLATTDFSNEF